MRGGGDSKEGWSAWLTLRRRGSPALQIDRGEVGFYEDKQWGLWKLFCGGDFVDDGLGGGAWVGGGGDGAADDEEVGAGFDGFGGSGGTGLVVGFAARACRFCCAVGVSDFAAGRTPGVTMRKSRPQALRMARASWTLATTPSTPADFASFANFTTRVLGGPPIPTSRIAFASMLVSTVTAMQARTIGAHRDAGADGLRGGVKHRGAAERVHVDELHAGHRGADKTAPATVFGMS